MKKLITLSALLGLSMSLHAQQTYFSTDFEQGMPESFTLYDLDGRTPSTDMANLGFAVGTPWIVTLEEGTNNHVAMSTSWYKNAGQSNDWMVTGAINVTSEKAVVSWRSKAYDKTYRDGFSVYVFTSWADVEAHSIDNPVLKVSKENADWTQHCIDLKAYNGQTVWIALVNDSKDKSALLLDDLFVGLPSKVGLTIDLPRCYDGYGHIPLSGTVKATTNSSVDGFTVGFDAGEQHFEQTFNNKVAQGEPFTFTLSDSLLLDKFATTDYRAWVKSDNDTASVTGRVSAFPWRIVAEEVTGTWCGYCVRGIGALRYMRENYPDGFIGIAVHNDGNRHVPDSMAIPGEEYLNDIFSHMGASGFPHSGLMRNILYWGDPAEIPDQYTYIKGSTANYTGVGLSANYNASTGEINAATDVYFAKNYKDADFRLGYVVVEDSVHRTHAETGILNDYCGYDQINYYAGGGMGPMYGFEDMGQVLNADTTWFEDVARGLLTEFGGFAGIIPSQIKEGDSYHYDFSAALPSTVLKPENASLVALLIDKDGVVVNAEKSRFHITSTGISNVGRQPQHEIYYTLSGLRLSGKPTKHGVYIVGGKKVML